MSLPLRFTSQVWCDLEEVQRYYARHGSHLPRAFEASLRAALARISEFPGACPVYLGEMRRLKLKRFKYYVGYSVEEAHTLVIGIVHTARSDDAWQSRIGT